MSETTRRQNNEQRILHYLQVHGVASNVELVEIGGLRYGARLFSLRKRYDIRSEPMHGGLWRISYHGERTPTQLSVLD